MQNEKLISEEYLIKAWETEAAKKLKPIMSDLGAWRSMSGDVSDRWWSGDSHLFVISDHKQGQRRNEVKFFDLFYMDGSGMIYGKPSTSSEGFTEVDGTSKVFDNSGSTQSSKETISREIRLASIVSHSYLFLACLNITESLYCLQCLWAELNKHNHIHFQLSYTQHILVHS